VVCLPVLGEGAGACRCVRLFHAYATNDRQDTASHVTTTNRRDTGLHGLSYSLITCVYLCPVCCHIHLYTLS
jgi:hypothetical protein